MREWNGKLVDNDHRGDALASIIMDYAMLPSVIIGMGASFTMLYLMPLQELWLGIVLIPVAIIVGGIIGAMLAALIGLGAVFLLILFGIPLILLSEGVKAWKQLLE